MCRGGVRRVVIVRRQASRDPRSRRVASTPDKRGQITTSTCAKNVIIREWDDGASKNHVKRTWCRVANHVGRVCLGEAVSVGVLFTGREGSNMTGRSD